MEQASALYDRERHRRHTSLFGQDPGVACKAFGSVALWLLGYPEEARRQSDEAVRLSHELSQPSSQALALHFAGVLHQLGRDAPRARVCAEACGAIASEHGFAFWRAGSLVMGGWALAGCGEPAAGVDRLRRGLDDWAATGSVTYRTYFLGLLAEVLGGAGRAEEALRVLGEALALARQTGEGLYEAELLRLRGELRRGEGRPEEEDFRQALGVARKQGARSLELRAALSLARLLREGGRGAEGRPILAEVYGGFPEGQDAPDLREARALLEAGA